MSYEFFARKTVTGRKAYSCEHCRKAIPSGEPQFYCAGKFDGEFVDYREHIDCQKAWQELNNDLRDRANECGDGFAFLADDDEFDDGEREWMREHFPTVASRLWPNLVGVQS